MKRHVTSLGMAMIVALAAPAHSQDATPAPSAEASSKAETLSIDNGVGGLTPGEAPSDALNALLARTKAHSHAYGSQIADAVQSSPRLAAQLNALVASGKLSDIVVQQGNGLVSGGSIFRGAIVGTRIVLTEGLIRDIKPRPYAPAPGHVADSTVFVLGQIAYHAEHDPELKAKSEAASAELFAHRNADGSIDATQFLIQSRDAGMDGEARAFFQGWNDMVDAATLTKGSPLTLTDVGALLPNSTYGGYLARSMLQPGGSLKWDPSSGYLFATDKNLQTMVATLGTESVADIQ